MEPNQDDSEVLETTETDTAAVETAEEKEPTVEELKAQVEAERKARIETEEKNKQLFERAKKAEGKVQPTTPPAPEGLSNKDLLFLAKADIHEDDLDEVLERAKFKNIPVSEAYKQVKPLLDAKAEERKTAAATMTSGSRRAVSKVSGDDILQKAESTGEVPSTDEGMQALFAARQARKLGKK